MIKLEEILDLSVEERIWMIEKIWDSIDDPNEIQIPGSHEQELDNRLNRYEKGETKFVSWNKVKSRLNTAM